MIDCDSGRGGLGAVRQGGQMGCLTAPPRKFVSIVELVSQRHVQIHRSVIMLPIAPLGYCSSAHGHGTQRLSAG